jgi:hypothetical protein
LGFKQGLWLSKPRGCVAQTGADAAASKEFFAGCTAAFAVTECKIFDMSL